MNKLLFALVPLALSATAQADKTCARTGTALISEVHNHGAIDVGPSGFEIYASGAWHVYRHDPKAMDELDASGCLTAKELASVKEALAKAQWKITHNEIVCDAIAIGSTDWSAGKHTFSQVLCGHDSIDAETEKAFVLVQKLEQEYTPQKQR
jgi:hypothetical protein